MVNIVIRLAAMPAAMTTIMVSPIALGTARSTPPTIPGELPESQPA